MALFPAHLPLPQRDGHSAGPSLPKRRHQMDDGQFFDQRQWLGQPFGYSLQWTFSWDQLKYFEAWLQHEVMSATGYFVMTLAGKTIKCKPIKEAAVEHGSSNWIVRLQVEEIAAAPVMPPRGAIAQWPAELPTMEQDSYMYEKSGSWTIPELTQGLQDHRDRFRSKLTKFSGQVKLTQAERDRFWLFYRNDLAYGIAWFLFPFENGFGRSVVRCKFGTDHPSEAALGSMYTVSLSLETANAPLMTKTQLYKA